MVSFHCVVLEGAFERVHYTAPVGFVSSGGIVSDIKRLRLASDPFDVRGRALPLATHQLLLEVADTVPRRMIPASWFWLSTLIARKNVVA